MKQIEHLLHGGSIKVSPAAGWWMRTYLILPTELKATGPKGYITKGDVLAHIKKNNLQQGVRAGLSSAVPVKTPAPPQQKKAAPKSIK